MSLASTAIKDLYLFRDVVVPPGYRLRLYCAGSAPNGRSLLGYEFFTPDGKLLFDGREYSPSPHTSVDSDDSIVGLLDFLSLDPEENDSEIFEGYTPEQLAWGGTEDAQN